MNILIYVFIFLAKIFENGLATLRLIVVANGKKWLGAVLNGVIGLTWLLTAGMVVLDIQKDVIKIVVFVLGSVLGSYLGSFIEEKLAMGSNLINVIVDKDNGDKLIKKLRDEEVPVTVIDGRGKDSSKYVLMIMVSRKRRYHLVTLIRSVDKKALIVTEVASTIRGY